MKLSKQSLPRHTILAEQGRRLVAMILDFAFTFALFIPLFFASNAIISNAKTNALRSETYNYQLYSHLVMLGEDSSMNIYFSEDDYSIYLEPTLYFYTKYLPGKGEIDDIRLSEKYINAPIEGEEITLVDGSKFNKSDFTISWFNTYVLGIDVEPDKESSECYFTYVKNADETYNKDVLGVPKTTRYDPLQAKAVEITATDLAKQVGLKYQEAFYSLMSQPFYAKLTTEINFYSTLILFVAYLPSSIVFYIVIPLLSKNGKSLAKRILGLALANIDGYKYKKYQIVMRYIPFFITLCATLFIPWGNIMIALIVPTVIILTSGGITLASPKRCSLHDYLARTIVINEKASTLFNDVFEEDEAIALEEGREKEEPVLAGEEPEISYEK